MRVNGSLREILGLGTRLTAGFVVVSWDIFSSSCVLFSFAQARSRCGCTSTLRTFSTLPSTFPNWVWKVSTLFSSALTFRPASSSIRRERELSVVWNSSNWFSSSVTLKARLLVVSWDIFSSSCVLFSFAQARSRCGCTATCRWVSISLRWT